MVQSLVNLNEHETRVLDIVKGLYGVKNRSDAVKIVIQKFEDEILEPNLRPDYALEIEKIDNGKFREYANIEDLRKTIENV